MCVVVLYIVRLAIHDTHNFTIIARTVLTHMMLFLNAWSDFQDHAPCINIVDIHKGSSTKLSNYHMHVYMQFDPAIFRTVPETSYRDISGIFIVYDALDKVGVSSL